MSAPRLASLIAVLLLTPLADLLGQQDTLVAPGARVRVYAPDRFVGTVEALNPDALVLGLEHRDSSLAILFASITRLEVSVGQKSRARQGAAIGFFAGIGLGLAMAAAFAEDTRETGPTTENLAVALGLFAAGTGLGALAGYGIGSGIKVERWETVPLDQIRVTLMPYEGLGLTVSATVAF